MFDDMYIPWTPRFKRKQPDRPQPEVQERAETQNPSIVPCNRTLHFARVIMMHALAGNEEASNAISSAFVAYIKGKIKICTDGPTSDWAVVPVIG
jgi:hypothetical protein